jgi:type IV secretion system protein VirB6
MAGGFKAIEDALLEPVKQLVEQAVGTLSGELRAPMTAALTVYVVWTGWMILQGKIQEPLMGTIQRLFKACIVFALATGSSEYLDYFARPMLTDFPDAIGKALNGSTTVNATTFDAILDKVSKTLEEGWERQSYTGYFKYGLVWLVTYSTTMFLCVAGFLAMTYAKMGLGLVLALGPLFIAGALFDATRRFSEAFVGTAVGFVILQALVAALMALILKSILGATGSVTGFNIDTAGVFGALVTQCVLGGYLFAKLPGIASGLGAGAYFSMGSVQQSMKSATGVAMGVVAGRKGGFENWERRNNPHYQGNQPQSGGGGGESNSAQSAAARAQGRL